MNSQDNELLRDYERQLDRHYTTLDLWQKPRAQAVYGILTIPDAVFLVPLISPRAPATTDWLAQFFQNCHDGVSQSLKWLCADGLTNIVPVADTDLLSAAHKFALFAADYANIADFHMMLGRGLATVTVDAPTKTVTFNSAGGPGVSDDLAWHEQVRHQDRLGRDAVARISAPQVVARQRALAQIPHELLEGRIVLGPFPDQLVASLGKTALPTREFEACPLPTETDFLGFTIDDFWRFSLAIDAWSHAAFDRYSACVMAGVSQHLCMPVQVVTQAEFVDRLVRLSGLGKDTILAILDRLMFRPGPKADLRITPFLCSQDTIAWSPTVIMHYRHERNMLKIMARGSKKLRDHAATLNGSRDRLLARRVATAFNSRGYQFKLSEPISANGETSDVDLLLWSTAKPSEVLLIEAKALLAPDEINEVSDAAAKMLDAQRQVVRTARILRAMPIDQKRQKFKFVLWEVIDEIVPVVVTADAEPHQLVDQRSVPVISLSTLTWRIRRRDFRSPRRFAEACKERRWLTREIQVVDRGHRDILVGDLTYRLPTVVSAPSPAAPRPQPAGY